MMTAIEIIPYEPSLKSHFKTLNYEWLDKYFFVTNEDDKILSDPEKIIGDGGCVLFAKLNGEISGTCALIKESEEEYEIAKMGVTEKAQGNKVGYELMQAIVAEAKKRGAKIISLDTAKQLKAAIHLYKKFGFIQTNGEETHPLFGRITFRMELRLP
jgi:GNAT superfamily N-acetyltransferase